MQIAHAPKAFASGAFDKKTGVRAAFIEVLKKKFPDYGLTYSVGGKISFDVFPNGWDKTYCLQFVKEFEEVHFFGDKTAKGGNDYEIYMHPGVKGHSVTGPVNTVEQCKQAFNCQ